MKGIASEVIDRQQIEMGRMAFEIDRLRFTLEHIMFIGLDCPPMADQAVFYKAQIQLAVSVAAKTLQGSAASVRG